MTRYTIDQNLPPLVGKTAYDVGCGAGFALDILLNKGLLSYTGLDLSPAMFEFLTEHAGQVDPQTKVQFIQGDNTKPVEQDLNPFDFVISSYSMYVDSNEKLLGYCNHLFSTLKDSGELLLLVMHHDFVHTRERMDTLAMWGHKLSPVLGNDESFSEFSNYFIHCGSPYFSNSIEFDEYVVGKATLVNALKEAGFTKITPVEMMSPPGHENLLEFAAAWSCGTYRCRKD
jgi:SAM-dependent methyltransferase